MRLGYTLLYVENVEQTVEFYEAAFGLKRRFVDETGQYGEMDTGATTLGFVSLELAKLTKLPVVDQLPDGQSPAMEIAFVTEDVDAAFSAAVDAGAEALSPPQQKPWGQTVAYVRDNNRFLVEICSPMK